MAFETIFSMDTSSIKYGPGVTQEVGMPNGLKAVGYGPEDVDKMVEATLPQHRVTKLSPRPAGAEDLIKTDFFAALKSVCAIILKHK